MAQSTQREPKIIKEILIVYVELLLISALVGGIALLGVSGLTLASGLMGLFFSVAAIMVGAKRYTKRYVEYVG